MRPALSPRLGAVYGRGLSPCTEPTPVLTDRGRVLLGLTFLITVGGRPLKSLKGEKFLGPFS